MMSLKTKSKSNRLFEDIFQLQTTIPDIDPEDPEDGFKSGITEGALETEALESTNLRKKAAIIPEDPKYRGKKISRKALLSQDGQDEDESSMEEEEASGMSDNLSVDEDDESRDYDQDDDDDDDDDEDNDNVDSDVEGDKDEDDGDDDYESYHSMNEEEKMESDFDKTQDSIVMPPSDTSDKQKGKIVCHQVDLWDEIIKCRISLQRIVSSCNTLPTPDAWGRFASSTSFKKESSAAHASVQKVVTSLLDLQQQLTDKLPNKGQSTNDDMDEEITSESEVEDNEDGDGAGKKIGSDKDTEEDNDDDNEEKGDDEDEDEEEDEGDTGDEKEGESEEGEEEEMDYEEDGKSKLSKDKQEKTAGSGKLNPLQVKSLLGKRHRAFKSFRNSTLEKWDEKTRLSHAKIKSKNFAAFDVSVLKQIQQVLGNKERLIKRIHQNRSAVRTLGQPVVEEVKKPEELIDDDDDEVEIKLKQKALRPEMELNYEIVDDGDFYQVCLQDFIQLKQNEETDPILANKYWIEIQNLRKKHKRKVDTRASKGRKIRYHVKEKLKNFMAPYDKSLWSDEQKDDLFKALFGGKRRADVRPNEGESGEDKRTINIGL